MDALSREVLDVVSLTPSFTECRLPGTDFFLGLDAPATATEASTATEALPEEVIDVLVLGAFLAEVAAVVDFSSSNPVVFNDFTPLRRGD